MTQTDTRGGVAAVLIRFSLPLIISGILQQLYNWADAFIVGHAVGESALAAVEKGFGGICYTDHCVFYVPKMNEEFEPIVCEVFDVDAQQAEIDRVNGLATDGGFGKSASKKFKIFK